MKKHKTKCRTLLDAVENIDESYLGDLTYYYRILIEKATNLSLLYHGLTHINRVLWYCYIGGLHYMREGRLTAIQFRILLIAALFHDFNHSGKLEDDRKQITRAIKALRKHILDSDRPYLRDIEEVMWATLFPYGEEVVSLSGCIIRDADMTQALDLTWMGINLVGLSMEWKITFKEMLLRQEPFLKGMKLESGWGRNTFPQHMINEKIRQARQLRRILCVE